MPLDGNVGGVLCRATPSLEKSQTIFAWCALQAHNFPTCVAWHALKILALQFNARSETVGEKGVFKKLLSRQRCVVFLNGFYEWKKVNTPVLAKRNCYLYGNIWKTLYMWQTQYGCCRKASKSSPTLFSKRVMLRCEWLASLTSGKEQERSQCTHSPS